MAELILLGTGGARTDSERSTTMLAFEGSESTLLIDCGGDVVHRCLRANINLANLEALFLSHEHPDHVSGFPLFMEKIWLHGRRQQIPVLGIEPVIRQTRQIFSIFDTSGWDGLPTIDWIETPLTENAKIYSSSEWQVFTSPGKHGVPCVGYRVDDLSSGLAVCYSCDTEPVDEILRLAFGCAILVHEANGAGPGHTSAQQAAEIAKEAEVGQLILVHIADSLRDEDIAEARSIFPNTTVGSELQRISI